ncbi:MAG: hypothetical protein ACYTE8_00400 [Planctomycetota bacterium]|jgi:hypothetical protein
MTLAKGIQIGQFLMGAAGQVQAGVDRSNAAQDEADMNTYLQMIRAGQNPEEVAAAQQGPPAPEGVGGSIKSALGIKGEAQPGKINNRALAAAYEQDYKLKMQDQQFRANELKLRTGKATEAKDNVIRTLQNVDAALSSGQEGLAKEHVAMAYSFVNNGDNISYDRDSDKFYIMETNDKGEQVRDKEWKFPGWDSVRKMSKTLFESNDFEKMHLQNSFRETAANFAGAKDSKAMVDKDGNRVGRMAKQFKDGVEVWNVSLDGKPGVQMTYSQALQQGMELEDRYLKTKKAKADIKEVESKTKTRGLTEARLQKESDEKIKKAEKVKESPELIRARDYVKSGQFEDLKTAMAEVRSERTKAERIRMAVTLMEDVSFENRDEKKRAIMRAFGVTAEDINPAKGLGIKARATTAAKKEAVKTGKGISRTKKSDFTQEELKAIEADKLEMQKKGWSKARIAEELRKKYSK